MEKQCSQAEIELIERCNPGDVVGEKPDNKPIFLFARRVKMELGAPKNMNDLKPLVEAFAQRWKDDLQDFDIEPDEVWPMFADVFKKLMRPSLDDMIREAKSFDLPEPWCRYYSEKITLLAKVCMIMQRKAELAPFPLAQSVAAKVLGKKPTRAHYILKMLVDDNFLKLAHQGYKCLPGVREGATNQYFCPIEIRGY